MAETKTSSEAPAKNAVKAAWVDYAESIGVITTDENGELTKTQLIKAVEAKEAPAKSVAKALHPSTETPSYEVMLAARRHMNDAHSAVRVAERALRSAQSLNTASHRDPAVAQARERLNEVRQEASEATITFETLKFKSGARR